MRPAPNQQQGFIQHTLADEAWLRQCGEQFRALLPGDCRQLLLVTEPAWLRGARGLVQGEIKVDVVSRDDDSLHQLELPSPADVVVLQECIQHMAPLRLLGRLHDLLHHDGQILLGDSFSISAGQRDESGMLTLQSWQRVAQRCGWRVSVLADNTAAWLIALHRLKRELVMRPLSEAGALARQQHLAAIDAAICACAEGRRQHLLLRLLARKSSELAESRASRLGSIADFLPAQAATLFERSFDTAFDQDLWRWKYGEGRGRAVCAWRDGELVAHYGGVSRDIRYFSCPSRALQICDVMVLPEQRGFYSRRGQFFRTAATFLDLNIGYSRQHLLGFGFPNIKAMHVASRLGLYQRTDDFIALDYQHTRMTENTRPLSVVPGPLLPDSAAVQPLWQQFAAEHEQCIVGVRDYAYLNYRYCQHPAREYQCFEVRDSVGQSQALLWVQRHEQGWLLMDVLASRAMMAPAVVSLQQHLAPLPLQFWITRGQADVLRAPGCREIPLGIEIPCNAWSAGPGAVQLHAAWWLTAGDMDFL